ncbi:hypothetical protein [Bacillus sp. UMB0728]|uniref:hypothetical protein n=1 Tax=Bacillus sp. UMB0728 TaxID=2066052 RepID=UPI000C76767A|nr:hypothetical protein [Bacillus sp. UMB0728]PLR72321.1 hypothetical protein CYJ37_12255 [Bacillus sp. UMB0728]
MSISADNDRLTVIIPKKVKNELKELAAKENRSLSNYVVNLLESHVIESKNGIQRDQQRTLGSQGIPRDEYNQPSQPAVKYAGKEVYNPYEVDLNTPSPKRRNTTNFKEDQYKKALNDPKGDK